MIHLVLCWHFHQPDYRTAEGQYSLPWTYLHAIKDYADMAAHLEAQPNMRAVVNFVPTLLEQLDDYGAQFHSGDIRDPLLAHLGAASLDGLSLDAKRKLALACFRLNLPTMLEPFAGFRRLYMLWKTVTENDPEAGVAYLSGQYLADLVTWYHLAWTGETLRRANPWLLQMMDKGGGFSHAERQRLFVFIGEVLAGLVPRFRALADNGQIELSSTPHSHPIAPLLVDFSAAREARPNSPLPNKPAYSGGLERVRAHVQAALEAHAAHFGQPPAGFWPAEGGVSTPVLGLFSDSGLRWTASGEGVLQHSLRALGIADVERSRWLSRPYRLAAQATACFFRDDRLSDQIGFEYKNWFAKDAVHHFLNDVEEHYRDVADADPVVTVILDGENAWEYFPYNGWYFLNELYRALAAHPRIRATTFSEYLEFYPEGVKELPRLVAGSWVYGDFSTWIGDSAKNRAWDLLCAAKEAYDQCLAGKGPGRARQREAERILRSCESSDWFWWFGDYNPQESVVAFDELFRAKLGQLYHALGRPLPAALGEPICRGRGGEMESGGVMRRGGAS